MTASAPRSRSYFGVDLAWGEGTERRAAKETGLVQLAASGQVVDAGWASGIDSVVDWVHERSRPGDVMAIDAPLVVLNESGMRECEREVAQRYMRWGVGANATNLSRPWQGGVTIRRAFERLGYVYAGDTPLAAADSVTFFECYPYTTLVGADEFGYHVERPRYKRLNPALLTVAERRAQRAAECDELLRRMARLATASPSLDLRSHPVTAALLDSPSPTGDVPYKHREDLIDAAISAWTAALWSEYGFERSQVLGAASPTDAAGRRATIVAPARPEQRRMDDAEREIRSGASSPTSLDEESAVQLLLLPDGEDSRLFIELSHFAGADLSPAAFAIELALARIEADDLDQSVGFLVDSAVMSYCRAFFPSNVRRPLSDYMEIPERFRSVDERIREYRNMVVAHSQSSLTVTLPMVIQRANGSRHASGWTFSQPLPLPLLRQFAELIDTVSDHVDVLIGDVQARLEPLLHAAVPVEDAPLIINHELVDAFTARSRRPPYPESHTLYWVRNDPLQ
ncbi:DUF429 domain-containing protein [Agromyces humi]|uniref:DUF429 domain-containing protein n=1 Tax=Agromyces humi TaxID=1766800 RepID=UPI00135AB4F0|nr:DUF429 domain-containing protein [Agromyces humi]